MTIDVKVTYKNDKLKTLRKAAGLSQAQLGEMTGLNFRTLQHYEQGIVPCPILSPIRTHWSFWPHTKKRINEI